MTDPNKMMIDKQAEIITKLREQVSSLQTRLENAQAHIDINVRPAEFYKLLEKSIGENESLRSAWDDFIMVLKLVHPNLNDEYKNVKLAKGYNV